MFSTTRRLYPQPLLAITIAAITATATLAETKVVENNQQNIEHWLRGDAENLEMRIQGKILQPDGEPAEQASLSASLRYSSSSKPLPVTRNGHQFEVWVPAHDRDWYSLTISAESKDQLQRKSASVNRHGLRQTAINGLSLELQHSTRTVTLKVVHKNAPVAKANVKAKTLGGSVLLGTTNADGEMKIELLPNENLNSYTVWTDDQRFGGFQFSREPVRDPDADAHVVELASCRDQVIRVVTRDGKPCPEVAMHLKVATPPPHFNFLGSIDASRLVTDENGDAVFEWFPDWDEIHCYVDLESNDWVIDGKSKWIDGDFVVQVKPRKERQRAFGKLKRKAGSKAGFNVSWRSFEAERENRGDFITAVTDRDGNFSASVLPGATYCVFINDNKHVSDMIDLIPVPADDIPKPTVTIRLQKPEALDIVVTAGPKKRLVPNQAVYVRQSHNYQWMEDDKQKSGSSARDRYVYTDGDGKATAMVESGKEVRVSINNPDWRISITEQIVEGDPSTITLHREVDEPRMILGILVQDKQNLFPTSEITVIAGSVDGETRGSEQLPLRDNGVFAFQTQATAVGMLAFTKDRSAAGLVVAENPRRLLRLKLQPTKPLRGRLVDPEGKPIVGRTVNATIRVVHEPKNKKLNTFYGFDADRHEVKTDVNGFYTFAGMPCDTDIALSAETLTRNRSHWLGIVKLRPNKEHPVDTNTLDD